MTGPKYSICLDVGAEQDHSVFTVLERKHHMKPELAHRYNENDTIGLPHYNLVFLEQLPLKTSYPAIIERTQDILENPVIKNNNHFLIDASGVGNPLMQMMYSKGLAPIGVVIVSGLTVNAREGGGYNVPKRDLVTSLQAVMNSRRLQIPKNLPNIEQLRSQILNFKMKQKQSGSIGFEAASERVHDDIVMSLAINIWYLERLYAYEISYTEDKGLEQYDPFGVFG